MSTQPSLAQRTWRPSELKQVFNRSRQSVEQADVCLILEGAYPYVSGGVSSWTHALIQSMSHLRFSIVTIQPTGEKKELKYTLPENVVELKEINLSRRFLGRSASRKNQEDIHQFHQHIYNFLENGRTAEYMKAKELAIKSQLGQEALLNSRQAWNVITERYEETMSHSSLLQFFWTTRSMISGLLVTMLSELPRAKCYHSICTGYAGLLGAGASIESSSPHLITEHGIYTNERRIELNAAEWLFDSGKSGYAVDQDSSEIRDIWLQAFQSFARFAYNNSSRVTTLYGENQRFQKTDGAPAKRLMIIPNGVDYERFSALDCDKSQMQPTIALIGRIVPIKDIRMFINACAIVKAAMPDARAILMGGDDEDPEYARECYALADSLGLSNFIEFSGNVDITQYLPQVHVVALTSLSEAQPLVLLEAGAAGIPTVSTDVGSCREMIEGTDEDEVKGTAGVVVRCGDASAAGQAMLELLSDRQQCHDMGQLMKRRVEARFNKINIDARYKDLYEETISSKYSEYSSVVPLHADSIEGIEKWQE